MRSTIIALLSTTFVLLPILNGFAQDFSFQLQEALKAKDWNHAIEIVDKMIQANPQQAQELMEYRAQLNKQHFPWKNAQLLWKNAQLLRTLKARGAVYAVALSRDGKTLVSGGDKTLEIWNLKTGESKLLLNWMIPNGFKDFSYIVKTIAISSNGKYIRTTTKGKISTTTRPDCTVSSDNQGANYSCNLEFSFRPEHKISNGEDELIMKNGSSITKYSSREIGEQLWNLETGEQVDGRSINIFDEESNLASGNVYKGSRVVNPDIHLVASVSDDGTIKISDMEKGQLLNTLTGSKVVKEAEQSTVTFMAFSSDGKTLIRADADGTIEVWTTQ